MGACHSQRSKTQRDTGVDIGDKKHAHTQTTAPAHQHKKREKSWYRVSVGFISITPALLTRCRQYTLDTQERTHMLHAWNATKHACMDRQEDNLGYGI
jgi:hypothetical protein